MPTKVSFALPCLPWGWAGQVSRPTLHAEGQGVAEPARRLQV